jgi:hypothetical protein
MSNVHEIYYEPAMDTYVVTLSEQNDHVELMADLQAIIDRMEEANAGYVELFG